MQRNQNIAFIGGGNMAVALIRGLLGAANPPASVHVVDVSQQTLSRLER